MPIEQACARAGIHRATFAGWRERAHEERLRRAAGPAPDLTKTELRAWEKDREHEQRYIDFLDSLERADLELERVLLETIYNAATPRMVRRTTMRRSILRQGGNIVFGPDGRTPLTDDVTTVEEHEEVDWRAAKELLRKRFPDRYSELIKAELTGAGGSPIRMEIPVQNADPAALRSIEDAFVEAGLMAEEDRSV